MATTAVEQTKRRRDRRLHMHWRHRAAHAADGPCQQPFITAVMLGPCRATLYGDTRTARAGEWRREMDFMATIQDPPSHPPRHTHNHSPTGALQPTIVSVSSLRALVEQNEKFQFLVVVAGLVGRRGLQCFSQGQVQQRFLEQNVDITVPRRGGFQGSRHGQGSTASSSHSRGAADEAFTRVFFRTFPQNKKSAKLGPLSGSELSADFSSSTPVAQLASPFLQEGRCWWHVDAVCPVVGGTFCGSETEVYKDDPRGDMRLGCFLPSSSRRAWSAGKCGRSFWSALLLRGL